MNLITCLVAATLIAAVRLLFAANRAAREKMFYGMRASGGTRIITGDGPRKDCACLSAAREVLVGHGRPLELLQFGVRADVGHGYMLPDHGQLQKLNPTRPG
jgi:hypothetical protein